MRLDVIRRQTSNGHDFTDRFTSIARLLRELTAKGAVLDGEIMADDARGRPDFARLHMRSVTNRVRLWVFDLLSLKGSDLRLLPLIERHASLQSLLERFDCPAVPLSEPSTMAWRCCALPSSGASRVSSAGAGIGARSRRRPGARRTGSDGDCLREPTMISNADRELLHQLLEDVALLEASFAASSVPAPPIVRATFVPILRRWITEGLFYIAQKLVLPLQCKFMISSHSEHVRLCKASVYEHWMGMVIFGGIGVSTGQLAARYIGADGKPTILKGAEL